MHFGTARKVVIPGILQAADVPANIFIERASQCLYHIGHPRATVVRKYPIGRTRDDRRDITGEWDPFPVTFKIAPDCFSISDRQIIPLRSRYLFPPYLFPPYGQIRDPEVG